MGPGLPWSFKEGRDLARPNVVMILVDDLGWTDLGCYGNELHDTPMLDRLAQEGTRFTNAYASAPNCSPTRSAILTGEWPVRMAERVGEQFGADAYAFVKRVPSWASRSSIGVSWSSFP